jgi:hypothetical protein
LLPELLENPSVSEGHLIKLALSASRESIEMMLNSQRVRSLSGVLEALKSSPYLKREETEELQRLNSTAAVAVTSEVSAAAPEQPVEPDAAAQPPQSEATPDVEGGVDDEVVSTYLQEHANDIAAEWGKPFQAIGGIVDLLGADYFPVTEVAEAPPPEPAAAAQPTPAQQKTAVAPKKPAGEPKRENALQKINKLDVKGRIQLALKGNKEERSLLIRDGTKVVALAVLEGPKLADGEVEKFASQKNVLEAVLRQIPLKRRFMKNYIVVRNLVANPRTPLDLGLSLMKNILIKDLKNISGNKEVSETIRNLAGKMYKQKLDAANKK